MIGGLSFAELENALSGVALALVGVYVWRVRPDDRTNGFFAVYAVGFGLGTAADNFVFNLGASLLGAALASIAALFVMAAVGLVGFALAYPRNLRSEEWRGAGWMGAALAGGWIGVLVFYGLVLVDGGFPDAPRPVLASLVTLRVALDGLRFTMVAAGVLMAFRFNRAAREGAEDLPSLALVAIALTLYPTAYWAYRGVSAVGAGAGLAPLVPFYWALGSSILLSALWIRNTVLPRGGRIARNVAIVTWLPALIGGGIALLDAGFAPSGLMRTAEVLILAYAILRHQLLGIDVKIRWGISRSTIAAAFVAAFFVASEGAQILFGSENPWVGLMAAGALVFAIAPLQRAAERLAEKAVPPRPSFPEANGADSYRRAVRLALKDRRFTPEEEMQLATLAHEMGLTAPDATRIRFEVEGEARQSGGDATSPN